MNQKVSRSRTMASAVELKRWRGRHTGNYKTDRRVRSHPNRQTELRIHRQIKKRIENHFNREINSALDLYTLLWDHGKFKFYWHHKYSQESSIRRFLEGKGLNCVDWHQDIVMPVLDALGFKITLWRVRVTCRNGQVKGHWFTVITGKRFENLIFDANSAVHAKRPMGVPVCINAPIKWDWILRKIRH